MLELFKKYALNKGKTILYRQVAVGTLHTVVGRTIDRRPGANREPAVHFTDYKSEDGTITILTESAFHAVMVRIEAETYGDPVKICKVYQSPTGCAHVDGMLCSIPSCTEWQLAGVDPVDLGMTDREMQIIEYLIEPDQSRHRYNKGSAPLVMHRESAATKIKFSNLTAAQLLKIIQENDAGAELHKAAKQILLTRSQQLGFCS